jgi:hypothetical protein
MNQDFTNQNNNNNVRSAEDSLTRSIARFESAMERLAGKVEDSSHRMQHVLDIARHQKDEFVNLKNRTREAVAPIMPYFYTASDAGRRVVRGVRSNPRPFLWTAIGLVGSLWALGYFKKGSWSSATTDWDTSTTYTPDSNIGSGIPSNNQFQ